jgi:hypothetical protein
MTTVVFKVSVELTLSDTTDYIAIRDNLADAIAQYRQNAELTDLEDEATIIKSITVSYDERYQR